MRLATVSNLAEGGVAGDRFLAHYRTVARGGAAVIVTEALRVHPSNAGSGVHLYRSESVAGMARVARVVQDEGALLIAQLNHGGRQHLGREIVTLWAPSAVACPYSGGVPHEMTGDDVRDVIAGFVQSAVHARDAGLDGVEIHGAQGHLIQQFVSAFSNRRTDEWGGSFDARLRFPREIIRQVRAVLGPDLVVGYRMAVEEFTPGGITIDESIRIARVLVADGVVDYLSLAQGNFNSIERHLPDRHFPPSTFVDLQARVKAAVGTFPVVASGRIETPDQAEAIVGGGQADMVGLCRALIVDPEWPAKAFSGDRDRIRHCIACNQCWGWVTEGKPLRCIANATAGRELEWGALDKVTTPRHVVVAGGGPAGLEAARVAAERGHRVTILEKGDVLGGKIRIAEHVPHHEETGRLADFLVGEIHRLGVGVRTETTATVAAVLAERPDVVIVATGAVPFVPDVPGDDSVPVSTSAAAPIVGMMPGDRVVVVDEDGYYWAAAVMATLVGQGKALTLVTRFFEAFREVPAVSRITTLRALDAEGVEIRPRTIVDRIERGDVVVRDSYSGREDRIAKVAAVIWVGPQAVDTALAEGLRAAGVEVHVVGDAFAPRRLANAIEDGHRVARLV